MKMEGGGMLMGESCNNNDSEQGRGEIHNKAGRYANRKRLQVQRMKSFGLDAEEGIGEIFKKKAKVEEESSTPVGFLVAMETKVEDVEVDLRNYPSVSNGFFSMCGRRRAMEDAVTISPGLLSLGDEPVFDFFGVYDGHGGSEVAYLCRDMMHGLLVKEVDGLDVEGDGFDWKRAMEGCFLKMDAEVDERGSEVADIKSIGSTAVVALVGMEKVIVANCGDSRAVLSRSGQAVPLSVDHKPDRPDEMERVETAGGRVIDWNGYRVLGVLATSRSIGDDYLKPYVISEPEVVVMDRTDDDEFIILASDGLWDVMTNVLACDVVRRCFNGQLGRRFAGAVVGGSAAAQAAAILAELAMARGSRDNISVVVIELKGWKKQR